MRVYSYSSESSISSASSSLYVSAEQNGQNFGYPEVPLKSNTSLYSDSHTLHTLISISFFDIFLPYSISHPPAAEQANSCEPTVWSDFSNFSRLDQSTI